MLERLNTQIGIKNKEQLHQGLFHALQAQHSQLDLSVDGALRDLVEVELEQRAQDHQILQTLMEQTSWKTAKGAMLESHVLERANLTRLQAQKETWQVHLGKANTTQANTIEKGVQLQLEESNPPVYFLAKETATFTQTLTLDLSVEAEFAGTLGEREGVNATQGLQIVSSIRSVQWAD